MNVRRRMDGRAKWIGIALIALFAFSCHRESGKRADAAPTGEDSLIVKPIAFDEGSDGEEPFNASGVAPIGDGRFLFCDNHVSNALFELSLTSDGQKQGKLVRRPLQGIADNAVDDLEGMTVAEENGRRYLFVASSLSLKKALKDGDEKPERVATQGLLRVRVNADHGLGAENMPGFRDWLVQHEPTLGAAAKRAANDEGINIEGLAWDRTRHALLFGVRTPVPDEKPLVVPVKVKNLAGPWTTDNLELLPPIRLALEAEKGEQGIRSLEFIPSLDAFLVVVGKSVDESKAPFALYRWDGHAGGVTRRLPVSFAKKMKPEGMTEGTVGGKPVLLFVDDGGGYQFVPLQSLRF